MLLKISKLNRIDIVNLFIVCYSFSLTFPGLFKRFFAIILILLWLTDFKTKYFSEFTDEIKTIILIFISFISFNLLSFLWTSSNIIDSLNYIDKYWYLIPSVVILSYLKETNIKIVISAFLLGVFISEVFSYGNFFGIWQIGNGTEKNPSVFMHHVFYSIFLALTSLILTFKILNEKEIKLKIFYFFFLISVSYTLIINAGRTGQIALILTIITLIILNYKISLKKIILSGVIFILFVLINYFTIDNFKNRVNLINKDLTKITKNENFNTSIGARIGFWLITKEILISEKKNILLGIGAKQHLIESKKIIDDKMPYLFYNKELNHFHSTYLSIISQFGIISLLIFLYLMYKIYRLEIKNNEIKFIKYSLLLLFLYSSIVDVPFYKDVTLSLLALFIGIFFKQHQLENNKKLFL